MEIQKISYRGAVLTELSEFLNNSLNIINTDANQLKLKLKFPNDFAEYLPFVITEDFTIIDMEYIYKERDFLLMIDKIESLRAIKKIEPCLVQFSLIRKIYYTSKFITVSNLLDNQLKKL